MGGTAAGLLLCKISFCRRQLDGDEDLGCATRDELVSGIVEIKREFEEYKTIRDLQLEVILEHRKLERDVALVTYETGTRLLINRSQKEYSFESILVPPMSFHRF